MLIICRVFDFTAKSKQKLLNNRLLVIFVLLNNWHTFDLFCIIIIILNPRTNLNYGLLVGKMIEFYECEERSCMK